MKVKIIEFAGDSEIFEKKINHFVDKENIEIIDIKFQVNHHGVSKLYIALIMYKDID